MAQVKLIEFTGKGRVDEIWHAADLLIYSKSTRLSMTPGLLDQIKEMTHDEKRGELEYMARTIPSSWEMVDVMFLIEGVSRATAQQITRTRTGSYAMQSQRVTNVRDAGVANPYEPAQDPHDESMATLFNLLAADGMASYERMVEAGADLQDARGLLPLNVRCNLVAKYNFRSFVQLMRARASLRVQGEYADIAEDMRDAVLEAWPWSEPFFRDPQQEAITMLEGVVEQVGMDMGRGPGWEIAKAIDMLRKD